MVAGLDGRLETIAHYIYRRKSVVKNQWRVLRWKQAVSLLLLGGFLITLIGCTVYPMRRRKIAHAQVVYVEKAPPPIAVERRPPKPTRRALWIDGHWRWTGRTYNWVPGRWERNPRGAWVAGHWDKRPRGWVWVPGRWR